jgi:hypothetical protein
MLIRPKKIIAAQHAPYSYATNIVAAKVTPGPCTQHQACLDFNDSLFDSKNAPLKVTNILVITQAGVHESYRVIRYGTLCY